MSDGPFTSLNVMAVEDEAFSRDILSRVLAELGVASVLTAANGAEALVRLAEADRRIDLIICDIEMPEMDGFELVRKIRFGAVAGYKDVPFIMLTGADSEKNTQRARIHRIDGFLVKPPRAKTLSGLLRRLFATETRLTSLT